jgi:pilus assembly protein CpaC
MRPISSACGGSAAARFRLKLVLLVFGPVLLGMSSLLRAAPAAAQVIPAQQVISIPRGQSTLLVQPRAVQRISIGDPEIADAVVVSPFEVLVNTRALGTTTLIVWDVNEARQVYAIEVTADAAGLQRTIGSLYPGVPVTVTAIGELVVLTGQVPDPRTHRLILELARGTGATVVDQLRTQPLQQIQLQVRVAEVSRNAIREFNSQIRAFNPQNLGEAVDWGFETLSEGLIRLFLLDAAADLDVIFRALRTTGEVRTLAEPNLIALEGTEASFLAGGEFPFPVAQQAGAGQVGGTVTIEWREFGVRLNFLPTVTDAGTIRLRVAPEVSALDFTTGLVVSGFAVPSLLTRRATTEVELASGQTFAIAGLLDNNTLESVTRLPILGDLPIIGALFRSRLARQDRRELLVLVTPSFVAPMNVSPPVPTGEPDLWRWDPWLQQIQPVPPGQ